MNSTRLIPLIILIIATVIAAISGAILFELPKYLSIYLYGKEALGTVVAKNRDQHMSVDVDYQVGNQVFRTGGHAEDVGKSFDALEINERVPVFYDRITPEAGVLGDAFEHLKSSFRGTFILLFVPTLFFVFFWLKRPHKSTEAMP